MRSTNRSWTTSMALAGGVIVAGGLGEVVRDLLLAMARPSGTGIVQGRLLAEILATVVLALGPVVVGVVLWQRTRLRSLHIGSIGGIALLSGTVGRYIGIVLGNVVQGGQILSPTVLATHSDIALRASSPSLVLIILIGIVTAGLWSLVGVFAGIGLATQTAKNG